MNVYCNLTRQFNAGRVRAILAGGQRRALIHANERRLNRYVTAAADWAARWPEIERAVRSLPLREAHEIVVREATGVLPFQVPGGWP